MIKELQEVIDDADPFLVEVLYQKSVDELYEYIHKLQLELERVERMNNPAWTERQKETIEVTSAIHQLKVLMSNENKKGHTIT